MPSGTASQADLGRGARPGVRGGRRCGRASGRPLTGWLARARRRRSMARGPRRTPRTRPSRRGVRRTPRGSRGGPRGRLRGRSVRGRSGDVGREANEQVDVPVAGEPRPPGGRPDLHHVGRDGEVFGGDTVRSASRSTAASSARARRRRVTRSRTRASTASRSSLIGHTVISRGRAKGCRSGAAKRSPINELPTAGIE